MISALQKFLASSVSSRNNYNVTYWGFHGFRPDNRRQHSYGSSVRKQVTRDTHGRSSFKNQSKVKDHGNWLAPAAVQLAKDGETNKQHQKTDSPKNYLDVESIQPHDGSNRTARRLIHQRSKYENKGWREQLSSFEQYKHESDLSELQKHWPRLIDTQRHMVDWMLWLELISFRTRHHGPQGAQPLFEEIIRRNMPMPTNGAIGTELWHHLVMSGRQDQEFLTAIISFAVRLKQDTGNAWPNLYYNVIIDAIKTDPTMAYNMHVKLKSDITPTVVDYRKIFLRCASWQILNDFEGLYRDLPLSGMYDLAIPKLCELQRYRDAVKWHNLLVTYKDFPPTFLAVKPLLAHLAHIGDDHQLKQIVTDLQEVNFEFGSSVSSAEKPVVMDEKIGRENFNRQLGLVHGVSPKHLSDQFCARLFATKLFSIDTIINGLQMMALELIGPLSLREIATRDDCDTKAISRHISLLKGAGILPNSSVYSSLIQTFASNSERKVLQSLINCDLHPDAFEDKDLQERLLAQYYKMGDELQIERTLAAITVGCREQDLQKWRCNIVLRSHITLHRTRAVVTMLEEMHRNNIPITSRSSRHLRVSWLSSRAPGRGPSSTHELSIIINVTRRTLQSGRHVPILAWRELLRRLGMDGRLEEVDQLALWLVDFYTSPAAHKILPPRLHLGQGHHTNNNPQAFLSTLFTTAAQHAIVAWGFQQEAKGLFIRRPLIGYRRRPQWSWGLVLLYTLRTRGVPIHRTTIARICRHRLRVLFGNGVSGRHLNRRGRWINDSHARASDRHTMQFYIREMKSIWGEDLFQSTSAPCTHEYYRTIKSS